MSTAVEAVRAVLARGLAEYWQGFKDRTDAVDTERAKPKDQRKRVAQ